MRLASVVVMSVLLLAAPGCSGGSDDADGERPSGAPTVAREVVEQQISTRLDDEVGQAPETVDCPDDLLGEVGRSMRCTITIPDVEQGEDPERSVVVTVTEVVDREATFDIEVGQAP